MLNQRLLKKAINLHQQGNHEEAKELYEKLQRSAPKDAHLLHFRGLLAIHMGDVKGSIALLEKAIRLNGNIPEMHDALAKNYLATGEKRKAANAYNGLGNALQSLSRYPEAVAAYDESLKLQPGVEGVMANRLSAQAGIGEANLAEAGYRKIVSRLGGGKAKTLADIMSLGNALQALGEDDKALAVFKKAIALSPDFSPAHYNASSIFLLNGDFANGWKSWEQRWGQSSTYVELARCGFTQPIWTGQPPEAVSGPLLIVAEMGFGDCLHFARYVPMLAERGHDILFEVAPQLVSLMQHSLQHPKIRIIPRKYYRWDKWHLGWLARLTGQRLQSAAKTEIYRGLPFAMWVGLMSLPSRFATTGDNIPDRVPYLSAPPGKVALWRKILAGLPGKIKVGFVWAGNASHPGDYARSVTLDLMAPLFQRKEIAFISLQKDRRNQPLPAQENLYDFSDQLKDFSDTAGLIEALDMVLTVDTSVAHLAGALGKPVWIMIPKSKDWRWLREGNTSAWYPTAQLFRQPIQGEWPPVIEAVGIALDELVLALKPTSHQT